MEFKMIDIDHRPPESPSDYQQRVILPINQQNIVGSMNSILAT
jgi:hypothetical protein